MNIIKNAAAKKTTKKNVREVKERELVSFDFAVKYLLRGKSVRHSPRILPDFAENVR